MKKTYKKKKRAHSQKKDAFLILSNWENVDEYSEEEIEDLMDEYKIPDISYIEMIDKPEELRFE
jgi:hypothetical protein